MDIVVACAADDIVGESPVWDPVTGTVWWVDNERQVVHCWDGRDRADARVPGLRSIAGRAGGGVVAILDGEVGVLDSGGTYTRRFAAPPPDGSIWNDAKADPQGRLCIVSMDPGETAATGRLVRFSADGTSEVLGAPLVLGNGLGWSPDGSIVYWGDSVGQTIRSSAYPDVSGRPWVTMPSGAPVPDGLAVDAEGGVWSAVWDGAELIHYDPDGRITHRVPLPVRLPTSVAFGGDGLRTLYVTTARYGLDDRELAAQPLAGSLLSFEPEIPGAPVHALAW